MWYAVCRMKGLCRHARATSLSLAILFFGTQVLAADARYSELDEMRQREAIALSLDEAIALAVRDNRVRPRLRIYNAFHTEA